MADDRSIESLRNRIARGYQAVDPKTQTSARAGNRIAQKQLAEQNADNAAAEQYDIARQQRIDTQRQKQQEGQARVAQEKAAREQAAAARHQQAVQARAGAAAGMETVTDIETGRRAIATHEDGAPKFKPGPVGEPFVQPTAEAAVSGIPGAGAMMQLTRPAEQQTLSQTTEVAQTFRDDRGNQITAAPEGQKTDAQGNITIPQKDAYGREQQVKVGTDPVKAKSAELAAKADALALQKNQIAQSRLQVDAEYAPVKEAYSAAEQRMKALPAIRQNATGSWVTISTQTGKENPVDDETLKRFLKEKQQATDLMYSAKRDYEKFAPRLSALDAAEHQIKADHLRIEAERIKHEMRLPGNDGGVSRALAQDATGDHPYGKFLQEFGIAAQDAAATPEEQVTAAQQAKEQALLGELQAQPDGTPPARIPANDAAKEALATLKGVEGLTVTPNGPIGMVHGADGKWLATVEPDASGAIALTLRDDAQANQPINDLLQFDRAGNELPLFVRENDARPSIKETAQWATQVHAALQPQDAGAIMTGGDGAAGATGQQQDTRTDAERGKLIEQLGATPDQIKRRVANGEIPMQVGSALLKELYDDTLVPENFDDPNARSKWIEETTKKEIAAGVKPDQTTAARWKTATTKNSKLNAAAGPISSLWSTYSLSEQNELERDRVADYALANLGKPGVTRDQVKQLYGRDAADSASISERINSMSTAMGKTAKYDAGAAVAGMLAGILLDAGRYEVAMIGTYANMLGLENATGDEAATALAENLGLRNRDFANFANATNRNRKKWFTPEGRQKASALDSALANLERTIDADQQAVTRDPDAVRAAELQVRNAALELHGLAPDDSWPITADSLDPDKDGALGAALARYAATADPRQLELYKDRLLMSNGRRQFSAAIEQKTKGLGRAGQSFVGGMSVGWQELAVEVVADASFAVTGGASKQAQVALRAAQAAGTASRASRIGRAAMAVTEAAAKWERLGVKTGTLAKPLTAGERYANLAVKGGKLVTQGSLVGEPLEEMVVELGADNPDFGQAYLGGMMGSVVMLPVFAGISKVSETLTTAPEQAKFEQQVNRWTQHYNTTYAGTPGFTPITAETARTAAQFINSKASGSQANRMVAALKLLGLTEEQVTITPEEQAAAETSQQRVAEGSAATALDEKIRTNLESEAARLQQRLEQDSASDQTGTGSLKPDRRAALEEQLAEINSRLSDAAAPVADLQQQNAETDPAIQRTNAKLFLQQQVERAAAFIAEGEANAVDAVNAIAAETDPARKTFMQGVAKVAAGNAHLLTKNERSAIQGTSTQAGAAYFDSTVDPATGQVTEQITAEGRAELMETQPAIGRLVQTPESMALIEQSTAPATGPAPMQANAERAPLTPEQTAQATEMAQRVQANLEQTYPSLKGRIRIQQAGGTFVSSGVSTPIAENGTIDIIVPDLARELALNNGNVDVVEKLTEETILRHELVHVAQFGSVISAARAAGDTRPDLEIFVERYTAIAADLTKNHRSLWEAAQNIYGTQNWVALNNDWARAAELVRMLMEQRATGTTSELLAIVAQEKPESIVKLLADAIAYLKDLIASGFKSERIKSTEAAIATLSKADPALLAEHLAELEALYAQLLNAPAPTDQSTASPANRQQQPAPVQTGAGTGSPAQKAGPAQTPDNGAPQPAPGNGAVPPAVGGTVGSGKPGGARVAFEWMLVPREVLEQSINRELGTDQNRSRKGNLGSDEQIQQIRNYPDPQYLLQAPGAREGAPVVDDALDGNGLSVVAGNGRAAGITLALQSNKAGSADFIAATRALAESLGLDYDAAGADPILVRKVTGEYQNGTREQFVAESNKDTILAPTPAEQAKMDLVELTPILGVIEYGADGKLSRTSAKAAAVALKLPRTTQDGGVDVDTATRRVNLALLTRMADEAGIDFKILSAIIEGNKGNRAMSAILSRAGAISQLPGDLAVREHLFRALARFQSAARDIDMLEKKGANPAADWLSQQTMEIGESTQLTPEASILLAPMLQSIDANNTTALREFLNAYIAAAQAEQQARLDDEQQAAMFGPRAQVSAYGLLRQQLETADLGNYIAGTLPKTGTTYTPAPPNEPNQAQRTPEAQVPVPPVPARETPPADPKPARRDAETPPPTQAQAKAPVVEDDGSIFATIENGNEVATKPTSSVLARVQRWIGSMPGFQGGKREMAAPVTAAIEAAFSPEKRASFTKAVDFFGGGGNWGIFNALTSFPNIRDLTLYERNADRILKIRLFHEKGNLVADMFKQPNVRDILNNAAAKMRQSGVKSGSALAVRINTSGISDPLLLGLFQAVRDYAENSYAGATDADGNQTPEQKIATSIRIVAEQAALAYQAAEAFRQRGGAITYRNADSYQAEATAGQNVLSLVDPPYYLTKGYTFAESVPDLISGTVTESVTETIVGEDTYAQTRDLLARAAAAGNSIIYTDSAWWKTSSGEETPYFDLPAKARPLYLPAGRAILSDIVDLFDSFGVVAGEIGAGRKEILGIHGHDITTQPGRRTRPQRDARNNEGQGSPDGRNDQPAGRGDDSRQAVQGMAPGTPAEADPLRGERSNPVDDTSRLFSAPQVFYSHLERTVEQKIPARATPDQILATVKAAGVKAEEIKWSGIQQAVQRLAVDGKVSKDALLEHLRNEGSVKLEEVTLGVTAETDNRSIVSAAGFDVQDDGYGGVYDTETGEEVEFKNLPPPVQRAIERMRNDEDNVPDIGQQTKYAQYVLPGGENYREVVLAMPVENDAANYFKRERELSQRMASDDIGHEEFDRLSEERAALKQQQITSQKPTYRSSHFPDVPNYVAHMRTNEREGGLFIEEIQSDRHQAGRKHGYKVDSARKSELEAISNIRDFTPAEQAEWDAMRDPSGGSSVADAPYRKEWPLAMFKRALRDAVASGKDWIGWADGKTQADRFDLSKQVSKIVATPSEARPGMIRIEVYTLSGRPEIDKTVAPEELPDLVGKDLAQKIADDIANPVSMDAIEKATGAKLEGNGIRWRDGSLSEWNTAEDARAMLIREYNIDHGNSDRAGVVERVYKGVDLKVGGEGMVGFYDQILPKEIGKYVKQWGGKVEQSTVDSATTKSSPVFNEFTASDQEAFSGAEGFENGDGPLMGSARLKIDEEVQNVMVIIAGQGVEIISDELGNWQTFPDSFPGPWDSRQSAKEALDIVWRNPASNFWKSMAEDENGVLEPVGDVDATTPIWKVQITPEMRKAVPAGQSLFSAPQDITADFKRAFTPITPETAFDEWGVSQKEDNIIIGYRGERGGSQEDNNFGATEGHGLYIAQKRGDVEFFGKPRWVEFPKPKNLLVVDEQAGGDAIPLLNEENEEVWDEILAYKVKPTDTPWIRAHKQAAEKVGLTSDNWGERMDDYTRAITDELLAMGHDAVYVRSGGMEWTVILAKAGERYNRGTRSKGGTSLYSAPQATPQSQYAHKFLTEKLTKTGSLTPQEHQQLITAEKAVGQAHAFDLDDPALKSRKRGTVTRNWQQNLMLEMEAAYEPDARQMNLFSAAQDATRSPDESGEGYYERVKRMPAVTFPESRIVYHQTGEKSAAAITAGEFKSGKDVGLAEKRGGVYFADRDVNEGIYARTGEQEAHEGQQPAWLPIDLRGMKLLHTGYTAPDGTWPLHKLHGNEKIRGEFQNLPEGFDGFIDFLPDGRIYEVALPPEKANQARANNRLFSAPQITPDLIEAALAPLTPMHRQVFQASQATPTPAPDAIARRFSLSETAVQNILGQVRTRIRTLTESQQTGGLAPTTNRDGLLIPGRPERAMTTNPVVARAQQIRSEEEIPVVISNQETYATARQMIAEDRQGTLDKLISRRANGETMTLEEVAAAQLFLRELGPQDTDPQVRMQLAWLASDWIDQGTDDARRLQIRRDVTHNPAERAALYFRNMELTPQDEGSRKAMSAATTRAQKEAVLQKWFARVDGIKAKLKADGIDLDASMAALDAKLQAQRQAQNEASARHSNLVRSLEENAADLQRQAEQLRAALATAQGDTAAARQQAAEAELRAQQAAQRAQQAAALDPKATLRLNLEKLPLNHRAAIENILAGGTLDTAAMIGGTTVNAFRKVFSEFRDRINEAGQQAALLARDVQLGRLASASLSAAAGLDWASSIGIPTLDELDRRSVPVSPEQAAARNKRSKGKKTAAAAKTDPPMMSDAEFSRRIANPVTHQDRAQTFLTNAYTRAMAKLPVGKRVSMAEWVAKLPSKEKYAIQQDMALHVEVGRSTDKSLPTDGTGLLDFTDPESVKRAAQIFANETGTVMDSLLDFRRMAILSGAQTSVVNSLSAGMLGLFFNARRLPEAMVNTALRPFGIRSDKAATFSEFPSLVRAIPEAASYAVRHMLTAWKLEERDVDSAMLGTPTQMGLGGGGWHHEAVTRGRFVGNFAKLPIPTTKGIRMVSLGDIMRGLTYRQMTASDAFLTAFNGHLGAVGQAHRIAAHREKLTGAAYDARMAELMLPGSEAMVHGFKEGTRSTSTQPLGKTADGFKGDGRPESLTAHHTIDIFVDTVANLVNKGRKKRFGDMRDIFPFLLDLSAPFVVTPANLYKEAARLAPIVNLSFAGLDAIRAWHTLYGKEGRNHPEIAQQRAKQIWDSYRTIQEVTNQIISLGALYLIASYAAGSGDEPPLVTGTEPWKQTDRDARDTNARVMRPMSLRIPGTDLTFSYARMDPFATALASTIDMVRNHKLDLTWSEEVARFFTSQKNQVKEKTMLDGLARIFEAIEAPDRNAERYLADLAVSMVPNMVRQPVRELDPYVRDTTIAPDAGFAGAIGQRIGRGLVPQSAPPKLDPFGKPVTRRNADNPILSRPLDRLLSVIDPTRMVRLADVAPIDRYLFDYNATVKPEERIGIGPLDNHVTAKRDGKQVKLPLTPEERQEATARAAERAVKFLGTGWETRKRDKEGAERIKDIFDQFQRMETERLRQEKLKKPASPPANP